MTSNSRVSVGRRFLAWSTCSPLLAACVAAPMIDGPGPALTETRRVVASSTQGPYDGQRVAIRAAEARGLSLDDAWLKRIVHPDDYATNRAPVLIWAEVVRPFSDLSRTASPVIVLNGKPLTNSIVVREGGDRVYAVAPDRAQLGEELSIQVGWFGALPETISPAVRVRLARE